MKKFQLNIGRPAWITFFLVFVICLMFGMALNMTQPALAAKATTATPAPTATITPEPSYVGSQTCSSCHKDIHETWKGTLHSQAFSSPVFQEDWVKQGSAVSCLECHTTGYNAETGEYSEEGVTCESCHGPMQQGHPKTPMPITPDYTLCATCHKSTTDEWRASKHGQVNINCEACHNSHSQEPRADSVNELCGNCHKDTGNSFTHGTHANSGLKCSDCHMTSATIAHAESTGGLFATGLESVQAGAGQQARQEHQQDLNVANQEAQMNYQTAVQASMAQYNNAWLKYLASAERVTESEGVTGPAAGGVPGATKVVRRNVWGTPYLAPDFQTAWKTRTPTSW